MNFVSREMRFVREVNKFSMCKGVEKVLDESASVITAQAFKDSVAEFKNLLKTISDKDNQYTTVSKGATAAKDDAEDDLIEALIKIAGGLYVFARKSKNENLKNTSKVTQSGLKKIRDTELLQKAKNILSNANDNISKLSPYGITSALITDLNSRITTYENTLGSKESKFAESKASRQELGSLFEDADDLLKEDLDTFVDMMKEGNKGFYNKYQAARIIKDL